MGEFRSVSTVRKKASGKFGMALYSDGGATSGVRRTDPFGFSSSILLRFVSFKTRGIMCTFCCDCNHDDLLLMMFYCRVRLTLRSCLLAVVLADCCVSANSLSVLVESCVRNKSDRYSLFYLAYEM